MNFTIQDVEKFQQELNQYEKRMFKKTAFWEWGSFFAWCGIVGGIASASVQPEWAAGSGFFMGLSVMALLPLPLLITSLFARVFENDSFFVSVCVKEKEQEGARGMEMSWEDVLESIIPLSVAEVKGLLMSAHEHGLGDTQAFQALLKNKQASGKWVKGHEWVVNKWLQELEKTSTKKTCGPWKMDCSEKRSQKRSTEKRRGKNKNKKND